MLHTSLYFLALFSLSTSPNWAKLNQMPVEVLGFYRLGIAALLLGLWILLKREPNLLKTSTKINFFNKTNLWMVASGFFFFLHLWTYKYAAKNTSISNTMIIFSSNPIWASIGAAVFFAEKIGKRQIISYLLALLSVYILVSPDLQLSSVVNYAANEQANYTANFGDYSAVLSAFFYAAYMLSGKKARHHHSNTHYALIQYAVCAILFGFCIIKTGADLTGYSTTSWLAVAGLVILPTFLGHFIFTYLVNYMNLSLMTCGKLVEPILASIIAYYLFHEKVNPYAWISFILTVLSILILFLPARFIKKSYASLFQFR